MLVISHIWRRCRVNGEEEGEEGEEASVYNGYHGHRYPEIAAAIHREHVVQIQA